MLEKSKVYPPSSLFLSLPTPAAPPHAFPVSLPHPLGGFTLSDLLNPLLICLSNCGFFGAAQASCFCCSVDQARFNGDSHSIG